MITAITPTGDRPLAFALCQEWMMNQTMEIDQWIVIDDGKTPMTPFVPMEYVRREPRADDPQHTLVTNFQKALPFIRGNKIIIIEDDEYYVPEYVANISARLAYHELVGIKNSKYYHLPSGGHCTHANAAHASLAQTAFRSTLLPTFKQCLDARDHHFLDVRIWQRYRHGFLFVDDPPLYLGIKGLPGRPGIGIGHDKNRYVQFDTAARSVLKKLIPQDYQIYLDVLDGKLTELNCRAYFRGGQSGLHPEI